MSPAEKLAKRKKPRSANPTREKKLACVLREYRERIGLSQRDVAKAIGVSDATICQTENGCDVSLSIALKLAKFFDIPVESIWK